MRYQLSQRKPLLFEEIDWSWRAFVRDLKRLYRAWLRSYLGDREIDWSGFEPKQEPPAPYKDKIEDIMSKALDFSISQSEKRKLIGETQHWMDSLSLYERAVIENGTSIEPTEALEELATARQEVEEDIENIYRVLKQQPISEGTPFIEACTKRGPDFNWS